MTTDKERLRVLAEAATWTGKWYDAGCNTVHCTYDAAPPDMSEQFGRDMVRHIAESNGAQHPTRTPGYRAGTNTGETPCAK